MLHHLAGIVGRVHGEALHYGGLGGVGPRHKKLADAALHRAQRHAQHAGNGAQRTIQPKLAHKSAVCARAVELAAGAQQGQQQGKIVYGAGFAHICRSQIDRDAAYRPLESQIFQRTVYALGTFFYGAGGQAHQCELRQTLVQVCLSGD